MGIRCSHLGIVYRGGDGLPVEALADISLDLEGGEFVSLVGPSGCGKTSLLRALAGFSHPHTGMIERAGKVGDGSVCLVSQEDSLFPWMTALDNAAFALEMAGTGRAAREALARPLLARLGLEGREGAYPHELSSGMKQRVAMARAFLSKAEVLLMDEPFGALDAMTRQALQQELLREWSGNRRTALFVTHDVEEAVLLSSRVLVMTPHPGTILAEFEIGFEYPREYALTLTNEFLARKREIHALLGTRKPVYLEKRA